MTDAGARQAALRGSLRLRLLLGTLLWIALTIVVAGWALGGLFRQHVALQFHGELNTHLDQLAAHLVLDQGGQLSLAAAQSDPRFSRPYSGLYWQIDRLGVAPALTVPRFGKPAGSPGRERFRWTPRAASCANGR